MTGISDLTDFIQPRDFKGDDVETPVWLTIASCEAEERKDFETGEPVGFAVLHFVEDPRMLPLKKRNLDVIVAKLGKDGRRYAGARVKLGQVTFSIGGKDITTISIKDAQPASPEAVKKAAGAEEFSGTTEAPADAGEGQDDLPF